MDAAPKLALLSQLGVVPSLAQWERLCGGQEGTGRVPGGSEEAGEKLAGLLNGVALEAVESVKRLENHLVSMQVRSSPALTMLHL